MPRWGMDTLASDILLQTGPLRVLLVRTRHRVGFISTSFLFPHATFFFALPLTQKEEAPAFPLSL